MAINICIATNLVESALRTGDSSYERRHATFQPDTRFKADFPAETDHSKARMIAVNASYSEMISWVRLSTTTGLSI